MELGEIDSDVGDLEEVLHNGVIGVLNPHLSGQHLEDHLGGG